MRRMDKVTGRSDDMIILRGVNVFPTQIEEQILSTTGLAPHYQIELKKVERLDQMIIHVEVLDDSKAKELSTLLSLKIKAVIGGSTAINIRKSGEIPRSEGKAVRIIDNRLKSE